MFNNVFIIYVEFDISKYSFELNKKSELCYINKFFEFLFNENIKNFNILINNEPFIWFQKLKNNDFISIKRKKYFF